MIVSVDGSFMLHRARHVVAKEDNPTMDQMVCIFLRLLMNTVDQFNPSSIYVYFDKGRSKHRTEILEQYKGQRKKDPDCPVQQAYENARDFLHENLPSLGIVSVLEEGIEADDFAYLVAHDSTPEKGVHISDDRDWFLNLFPGWHLFRAKADELISYEDLCKIARCDEMPQMIYLITRSMIGDKSDNIPGIRGFGWETAIKFAPKILKRQDFGNSSKAKQLEKHMDLVKRNMCVMSPTWIAHSEEAREILRESVSKVQKVTIPIMVWKKFSELIDSDYRSEFMGLANKYNKVIKGTRK